MSSVAVVILNYNGKSHLEKFLPSVTRHSGAATIYVADNGSSDESLAFLAKRYPAIKIIAIETNLGFCGGYNYALKQIDASYYILLNNDVEVTANWITPMQSLLDAQGDIAAVQPKVLSYNSKTKFEYAGGGGGMIDALGYPFCRGRLFDTLEVDKGQYNDTIPVFWATGACMMIRSSVYHQHNGLDEDFFAHMEEIDLCWRIKRNGDRVFYTGQSTIYHLGGGTLAAGNPRKVYYNFRNGLAMLFKHLPFEQLIWKLPVRIVLDWLAAVRFVIDSPAETMAVARAHFYILFHLYALLKKRWKLKKELKGFAVTEVYNGSTVVDYYLLRKKAHH